MSLRGGCPARRSPQIGGGCHGRWSHGQVVVAVVNSVRDGVDGRVRGSDLLVADEVHRYGAEANSGALDPRFGRRLGLTATLERNDDGVEQFIQPYFGQVCYTMGYARALRHEVTSHFKVALIGVAFDPHSPRRIRRSESYCIQVEDLACGERVRSRRTVR